METNGHKGDGKKIRLTIVRVRWLVGWGLGRTEGKACANEGSVGQEQKNGERETYC